MFEATIQRIIKLLHQYRHEFSSADSYHQERMHAEADAILAEITPPAPAANEAANPYQCPYCEVRTANEHALRVHIEHNHPTAVAEKEEFSSLTRVEPDVPAASGSIAASGFEPDAFTGGGGSFSGAGASGSWAETEAPSSTDNAPDLSPVIDTGSADIIDSSPSTDNDVG